MDDDLASNYTIRSWLRHVKRYPVENRWGTGEAAALLFFIIWLLPALYMSLLYLTLAALFPLPDKSNPAGGGLGWDDIQEVPYVLPWWVLPILSFWMWRRLRRKRLSKI